MCAFALISSFLLQGVVTVHANEAEAGVDSSDQSTVSETRESNDVDSSSVVAVEPSTAAEEEVLSNDNETNPDYNDVVHTEEEPEIDPIEMSDTLPTEPDLLAESSVVADPNQSGEADDQDPIELAADDGTSDEAVSADSGEGDNIDNDPSLSSTADEPIALGEGAVDETLPVATSTNEDPVVEESPSDEYINPDVPLADSAESLAATTTTTTDEPIHINYDGSEVRFNKQECTELASGSFYCLKAHEAGLEDALYAAPDMDGDLEIFLVRAGEQVQITNNEVDDASPFYDQNSNSLVWHRLIDDRYQIISYDLDERTEEQLTKDQTNNMEPVRQGKYTVWQRWVGNSWDVVLHDGVREEVFTESSAHDIAPYIHGSLVVWNRYSTTQDKTIEMYDIKSATYVSVNDPEGLSVSNPRMVFVYDSLHPNGDVVTKGFDMITKKFISLDTLPRSLPDELPPIDSTGETRALIQSKPALKSEVEDVSTGATSTVPALEPVDPLSLDLTQSSTGTTPIMDEVPSNNIELTLDLSTMVESELQPPSDDGFEMVITPYSTE